MKHGCGAANGFGGDVWQNKGDGLASGPGRRDGGSSHGCGEAAGWGVLSTVSATKAGHGIAPGRGGWSRHNDGAGVVDWTDRKTP